MNPMCFPCICPKRALAFLFAFASFGLFAAAPWRVGVYGGKGANSGATLDWFRLIDRTPQLELVVVSADMAREGSVFGRLDAIVMPGGSTKNERASLGEAGGRNLQEFVRRGGCYYGTCAGCHLVLEDALAFTGYKTLGKRHEHDVLIDVDLTEEGRRALRLERKTWSIIYSGGPFVTNGLPVVGAAFDVWGAYADAQGRTNVSGCAMNGRFALLGGRCGKGRMVLSASHPECLAETYPLIQQGFRWLSGRDDITFPLQPVDAEPSGRINVYLLTRFDDISSIVPFVLDLDRDPRLTVIKCTCVRPPAGWETRPRRPRAAVLRLADESVAASARAFIVPRGTEGDALFADGCRERLDAFKDRGGLVLCEDDGLTVADMRRTIEGICRDRRTETACRAGRNTPLVFTGDRRLTGLDLRLSESGELTTVFAGGRTAFAADANGLGGDWVCGADDLVHHVVVSQATVSAVNGNQRRNSRYRTDADGRCRPLARHRIEIVLGAHPSDAAALSFSGSLTLARGSTLAVDARAAGAGRFRLIEAGRLTVCDPEAFVGRAEVRVGAGLVGRLSHEGSAVALTVCPEREPVP